MRRAAEVDIDRIWVDALNPRPRVWPSIAALLQEQFPEFKEHYRRVLFDPTARREYLSGLRKRVAAAARRVSLADRVVMCM